MKKLLYKTVKEHIEYEIPKIKWSRFIGNIFHIKNKEDAEHYLAQIQEKYRDATHSCYAYHYGANVNYDLFWNLDLIPEYTKQSDEGEPTNTAGKPILAQIKWHDLYNILIVVTRYFGGTMLGIGGLIQAYSECTKQTIQQSTIIDTEIMKKISYTYNFDLLPIVRNVLNKYDAKIIEEKYGEAINMTIEVNAWYLESFKKEIFENSKGQIKI